MSPGFPRRSQRSGPGIGSRGDPADGFGEEGRGAVPEELRLVSHAYGAEGEVEDSGVVRADRSFPENRHHRSRSSPTPPARGPRPDADVSVLIGAERARRADRVPQDSVDRSADSQPPFGSLLELE